jgi:serine/threonine protein phosphatase PrpC
MLAHETTTKLKSEFTNKRTTNYKTKTEQTNLQKLKPEQTRLLNNEIQKRNLNNEFRKLNKTNTKNETN